MNSPTPASPSAFDRALLALDTFPGDTLWRGAVGYALLPTFSVATGRYGWPQGTGGLLGFIVLVLFGTRVGAAVLRRIAPAGPAARQVWAERRKTAREFDSYQWKKLLGVGLGMFVWQASGTAHAGASGLAALLVVSGIAGWVVWLRRPSSGGANTSTQLQGGTNSGR